ncbi:hypothetical protein CC1G_08034 [Coprinopsis cinerea okayama7|uniref:DUF6534 domain-containing protein n=1 Tax=Coprinopsis cinerea (strain Okayama-7 / 130 / ATCC MYA-4618 / FGSC 9003) TaxID=240176 RepID=A8NQC4_COPC7|nr:hypothetical protein CC1G_08034 [Coprinopsis cinerea okayama7\|eukprot:XP_001835525.1 hypothetical protein CC1G_08034 [Coprinopsis cinerea okayama7\
MALSFPSVHETLGAALIGFCLACAVFGIFTTQVFIYYRQFYQDKKAYKILCYGTPAWKSPNLLYLQKLTENARILEFIDQIFIGYAVYYYSISNYGKVLVLFTEDIVWPLIAQVIVGNLVGTLVKCCFALRVWRFSHRNMLITGPIFVLILVQAGCAIAYCVRSFQLNKLLFASRLRVVASVALGSGMATDAFIAVALCLLLHRLRTGFSSSDSLINTLIVYAVNTGALTGFISFVTLLVYNVFPNSFYFMTFYFLLGKLYAISLLCTLNTRRSIRGKGTDQAEPPTVNTSGHRHNGVYLVSPTASRHKTPVHYPSSSNHNNHMKSLEIGVHQEVSVSMMDIERNMNGLRR